MFWMRIGVVRSDSSMPLLTIAADVDRLRARLTRRRADDLVENRVDRFLIVVVEFDADTIVPAAGVEPELDFLPALGTEARVADRVRRHGRGVARAGRRQVRLDRRIRRRRLARLAVRATEPELARGGCRSSGS